MTLRGRSGFGGGWRGGGGWRVEVILRCGWRGVLEGRERTEEEDGGEVCWGLEWMGGVEEEGGGN